MDRAAAFRLRLIGFFVVMICAGLLWLPMFFENMSYNDAIAGTLAIGIGLLLLAEVGPLVKTFKAGGMEIEFLDTVNDKFNVLEGRVAALEVQARHPERSPAELSEIAERDPDALQRPIRHQDDPHKGRFGEASEKDGYKLTADFRNISKQFVEVKMTVTAPPNSGLAEADCVKFYLHDSFNPDVVPAVFHGGVAELSVIAYGGFTVGAWIACSDTELELDLSKVKGAPRIIRDL